MDPAKVSHHKVKSMDDVAIAFDRYSNSSDRCVIIAPGFYNGKDALLLKDLAHALSGTCDVAVLDFRGHGESGGLFAWTSREYLDLLAVLGQIRAPYTAVGVIGFSLGAATSIIAAAKTDAIKTIVAVSSPSEFEKIEYHFWELNPEHDIRYTLLGEGRKGKGVRPGPFWLSKEKPVDLVPRLDQPVLYIHGTEDWIIKPWHSQVLFEKTRSKKRLEIVRGGPHAEYLLRDHFNDILKFLQDWLALTL